MGRGRDAGGRLRCIREEVVSTRRKDERATMGGGAGRTFTQIWLSDKATYPLFAAMGAGIALLCTRLVHATMPPEVTFSKKSRAEWERWTEQGAKDQADGFRNHAVRGFFKTVKPSMMPGLNEAMSK